MIGLLALLLVGAAACGGGDEVSPTPETVEGTLPAATTAEESPAASLEGDPAAGEEVFSANGCGSCHTLAAAGTNGTVGPNLDDAKPDKDLVIQRVTNGSGEAPTTANSGPR